MNDGERNELITIENQGGMMLTRPPEIVLDEAKKAAKALADVVSKKKKPVMMNGEQYLEFEDWQTVGRFYGISAKVVSTEYIEYGEAKGFQAKAVALRADGMEISGAEAMCLNDENNWKNKPLFQLRSMSQTRACAKALRNVLAWVVVLAGYKATPVEEIQDMASGKPPIAAPQAKQPETKATVTDQKPEIIIYATIEKVNSKEGKSGTKAWTLYGVLADGIWYNTFDSNLAEAAKAMINEKVGLSYIATDKGNNLTGIAEIQDAA